MMLSYIIFSLFVIFCSLFVFFSNSSSFMTCLLMMESSVLNLYFLFCFLMQSLEFNFILYFLVFCVCEGSLGLSILIKFIRSFNTSFFKSSNSSLC
uniref:NADH-ubiquinone oxidoreductase chain 4L n=1 Tax=Franklinothrips vespiformis TaxID=297892 RepID=A0A8A5LA79_FRAVS|nr:NADH dehydrogenase subunit 4L [Franklinothrips vespiformis]